MRSQYCYIYGCDFKASAYGNGCTISHMRKIVKKKKKNTFVNIQYVISRGLHHGA